MRHLLPNWATERCGKSACDRRACFRQLTGVAGACVACARRASS